MRQGEFASQQELRDYADAHDLAFVWEGTNAFAKRWHLAQLSQPGEYDLVEVRTKRGMTKAPLFSKPSFPGGVRGPCPLRERSLSSATVVEEAAKRSR